MPITVDFTPSDSSATASTELEGVDNDVDDGFDDGFDDAGLDEDGEEEEDDDDEEVEDSFLGFNGAGAGAGVGEIFFGAKMARGSNTLSTL